MTTIVLRRVGGAILMLCATSAALATSEVGGRVEEIRVRSPLMPRPVTVRLWLPAGMESAAPGSVPLLVFLHDGFGSERSFFKRGLSAILETMVARGEVAPFAVACPRTVGTDNSNEYLGWRTFDFLTEVLVPGLLDRYPQLRRDRDGRGVTGISLGGYGALKIALTRSDLFGSVSALSPWVEDLTFRLDLTRGLLGRRSRSRTLGEEPETSVRVPESLFRNLAEASWRRDLPPIFLMAGDEDRWVRNGNLESLEGALSAAGVAYETARDPGDHDWPFWREAFPRIARFHAGRFERVRENWVSVSRSEAESLPPPPEQRREGD